MSIEAIQPSNEPLRRIFEDKLFFPEFVAFVMEKWAKDQDQDYLDDVRTAMCTAASHAEVITYGMVSGYWPQEATPESAYAAEIEPWLVEQENSTPPQPHLRAYFLHGVRNEGIDG